MIGLGEALHRLDEDDQALGQWEAATQLAENEHTYAGVAQRRRGAGPGRRPARRAQRLPRGGPAGAAGGQAGDRRPHGLAVQGARATGARPGGTSPRPAATRGSRSRSGSSRSRRSCRSSRASSRPTIPASLCGPGASRATCTRSSSSTRCSLAAGELYRLWSVTLVHAPIQQMPLHLIFNMYFLYLAGPGRREDVRALARSCSCTSWSPRAASLASFAIGTLARPARSRSARRARCSGCSGC